MTLKTVILKTPIPRESGDVSSVTLREPRAGELRGLKLTDILQLDVSALIVLIPRISDPALTPNEVASLSPVNLTALGVGVVGFFVDPETTQPEEIRMT